MEERQREREEEKRRQKEIEEERKTAAAIKAEELYMEGYEKYVNEYDNNGKQVSPYE